MSGSIRSDRSLAISLAIALAALPFLLFTTLVANAGERQFPHLRYGRMKEHPNVLVMLWAGEVTKNMSGEMRAAFDKYGRVTDTVELRLNSPGGSVAEGERVIALLKDIKDTHTLVTTVGPGKKCGSMCVFIYVQGEKRLAAPASLWLFHEVSHMSRDRRSIVSLDRERWIDLVDSYWAPAGVDPEWIEKVKARADKTDVWEAGSDLLRDGSNIIHRPLSNEKRRVVRPVASAE